MSCRRLLLGLAFWVSIFVILPSAVAQPSAAEKAKQRTEAEQKVEALLREGKFSDAI